MGLKPSVTAPAPFGLLEQLDGRGRKVWYVVHGDGRGTYGCIAGPFTHRWEAARAWRAVSEYTALQIPAQTPG